MKQKDKQELSLILKKSTHQKRMLTPLRDVRETTAPEILLEEKEYDMAMDIWALGCTICELIHSSEPYIKHIIQKDPRERKILMKEHFLKG